MGYRFSKWFAKLVHVPGKAPVVHIHGRDADVPGLNLVVARNIERTSSKLYIHSYDSEIHGNRDNGYYYTIDAFAAGEIGAQMALVRDVNRGGLFDLDKTDPEDQRIGRLMSEAKAMAEVPLSAQWRLDAKITTFDEELIVKNAALATLINRGTWHKLHGEMINSSTQFPGSADFYLAGTIGFATRGDANAAHEAFRMLPYREVTVVKLYKEAGESSVSARMPKAA